MPVAGTIIEVNSGIADNPAAVNEDPYGAGWMIRVKISGETSDLLDADAYKALVG